MSIEALKYAAKQICRHFEMLNNENYRRKRNENFLSWNECEAKRMSKDAIYSESNNISYTTPVESFKVKESLPHNFRFWFFENWPYNSPDKMQYHIILKNASFKYFRVVMTTNMMRKPEGFSRPIQNAFKPFVRNIIVVNKDPHYDDILMQLVILALRNKFIEYDINVFYVLRSYVRKRIWLKSCDRQFIRELFYSEDTSSKQHVLSMQEILWHLVQHYIRPFTATSFKLYLKKIIEGLYKEEKRKNAGVVPRYLEINSPTHKSDLDDKLSEHMNKFQLFYDKKENEMGMGVDRTAMEFGIARDKIYRLIRNGKLKVRTVEGTYVLDTISQKCLLKILSKEQKYKEEISCLCRERKIKPNSARQRLKRLNNKKFKHK
jgi:DNA polymerase III psi subunit